MWKRRTGMKEELLLTECDKIFNFWKLEEYFTPSDYPELAKTVKRDKEEFPFDTYSADMPKNVLHMRSTMIFMRVALQWNI